MTLEELIRERHELPEWAVIFEFNEKTGYSDHRADAVAFNCWASKGFMRVAYEVKRTRADFMREIDHPMKRAWLEKHFHQCYFVTVHGIVKEDEVPEGWGLLVATKKGDKLIRRKAPMSRDAGKMAQGIALSAIRRLNQQLLDNEQKNHTFAGECVTQEDLNARVDSLLATKREQLDEKHQRLQKRLAKAQELESRYEAPFVALAQAARDFQYAHRWAGKQREVPTAEQIQAWVAEIRRKAVFTLVGKLQDAHGHLGAVLEDLDKAGLKVTAKPIKKQGVLG